MADDAQIPVILSESDWNSLLTVLNAAIRKEYMDENVEISDEIAALKEQIEQQVE